MTTLIVVTAIGMLGLILEMLNLRKGIVPITVIGLLVALGINLSDYNTLGGHYNNMVVVTPFAIGFSSLFLLLTIFLILLSSDFYRDRSDKISDFVSIKVFLLLGGMVMVYFGNLAMFFLGIEIFSIALYILAASRPKDLASNEAGMKYFLMGSFASGFILFGICLIYGAMGSFDVREIYELSVSAALPSWFYIGLVLVSVGMLFKIAAVPFHFWSPDVYQGSPMLTTTLMSTLAKVVSIGAFFKIIVELNQEYSMSFYNTLLVISAVTMLVGNIMGLVQQNVKRMLAFSGIAHAGYMLMAFLPSEAASNNILYYAAAYALAGIAAFTVIIVINRNGNSEEITDFNGLAKRNPVLALILTASLISMAGIPIFAGFFAKLMLFTQALEAGFIGLVIIAVISSIISVGYYFKVILAMYTKPADTPETLEVPVVYYAVAAIAILLNLGMGIWPACVYQFIK